MKKELIILYEKNIEEINGEIKKCSDKLLMSKLKIELDKVKWHLYMVKNNQYPKCLK